MINYDSKTKKHFYKPLFCLIVLCFNCPFVSNNRWKVNAKFIIIIVIDILTYYCNRHSMVDTTIAIVITITLL